MGRSPKRGKVIEKKKKANELTKTPTPKSSPSGASATICTQPDINWAMELEEQFEGSPVCSELPPSSAENSQLWTQEQHAYQAKPVDKHLLAPVKTSATPSPSSSKGSTTEKHATLKVEVEDLSPCPGCYDYRSQTPVANNSSLFVDTIKSTGQQVVLRRSPASV